MTTSNLSTFLLSGGYEWRRGNGRIQGLVGVEGMLGIGSSSESTDYGWDYDDEAADLGVIFDGSSRTLSEKLVEVLPLVSVALFLGWSILLPTKSLWVQNMVGP